MYNSYINVSRLVEFPAPGDTKKHLLPVYDDPEESLLKKSGAEANSKKNVQNSDEYWMPVCQFRNFTNCVLSSWI